MSDAEMEQLIGLGKSYKTLDKLWESEFHGYAKFHWAWQQRIPMGNEFFLNTWYTDTELRVLTDSWRIASSALMADHEMRPFTVANARGLASPNLVVAVIAEDRGFWQNLTQDLHIVLELDGNILQPTGKNESATTFTNWTGLQKHSAMAAQFVFALPKQHEPTARLVLIAGNGNRHFLPIDFRRFR